MEYAPPIGAQAYAPPVGVSYDASLAAAQRRRKQIFWVLVALGAVLTFALIVSVVSRRSKGIGKPIPLVPPKVPVAVSYARARATANLLGSPSSPCSW